MLPRPGSLRPGFTRRGPRRPGAAAYSRRPGIEYPDLVRTALTVEPRDGVIHVFLPPLTAAEDWLDLVTASIEDTAARAWASRWSSRAICRPAIHAAEQFFGHARSRRDRGQRASPATWSEQVERTEQLYEVCPRGRAGRTENSCSTAAMSAPAAAIMW